MTLKSTDGKYSSEMYVRHDGGLNYYYDRVIWNLDLSKEYYIEVKLTNENNISNKKTQQANIKPTGEIGAFNENYKMVTINNKIKFETVTTKMKAVEKIEEPVNEIVKDQVKPENKEIQEQPNKPADEVEQEQSTQVIDKPIEENTTIIKPTEETKEIQEESQIDKETVDVL